MNIKCRVVLPNTKYGISYLKNTLHHTDYFKKSDLPSIALSELFIMKFVTC